MAHTNRPSTADIEWERAEVEPEDVFDDEHFEETLDRLHRKLHVVDEDGGNVEVDDFEFFTEEDDETVIGEADADISLPQYLPDQKQDGSLNIPHMTFSTIPTCVSSIQMAFITLPWYPVSAMVPIYSPLT